MFLENSSPVFRPSTSTLSSFKSINLFSVYWLNYPNNFIVSIILVLAFSLLMSCYHVPCLSCDWTSS